MNDSFLYISVVGLYPDVAAGCPPTMPCAFVIRKGRHIEEESDGRICFRPDRLVHGYVNRCSLRT